jgi:hypothetical protein
VRGLCIGGDDRRERDTELAAGAAHHVADAETNARGDGRVVHGGDDRFIRHARWVIDPREARSAVAGVRGSDLAALAPSAISGRVR